MADCGTSAVALGIFDGVHRGHAAVVGQAAAYAAKNSLAAAVCTFSTSTVNTKGSGYKPIYSDETKAVLLRHAGAQIIYSRDFSEIKEMSPEEFVRDILKCELRAAAAVCGRDFRFGKGAACGTDGLERICHENDMELIVVDDVTDEGKRISSASIRQMIADGDIVSANRYLGHDYAVTGEIIDGNHFGRQMDFPTANQSMKGDFVLPRFGVYASYCNIDGKIYRGVTNIGVKPTVESRGIPLCETHFPEFSGDLYGKTLTVRLIDFIRPEMKFSGADELKARIAADTETIMNMKYPAYAE